MIRGQEAVSNPYTHPSLIYLQNANFIANWTSRGLLDRIIDDSKASRRKKWNRRAKLRMVKQIEEFGAEFEAHPLSRSEGRSLEYGEIKIDNALLTEAGIHARLVSKR